MKIITKFFEIYYRFQYFYHNLKIHKNVNKKKQNIILIELNNYYPNHILYSYLSNILSEKFSAEIIGYDSIRSTSIIVKLKRFVKNILPLNNVHIYKSFGLKNVLNLNKYNSSININNIKAKHNAILKNISKKKILNLKLDGIYIGDLLYDDFLRTYYVGSIDFENEIFSKHLYEFIKTFYLWRYYLKKNNVKSIILSHSVYECGLALRVAQNQNIPVYLADNFRLVRFNKNKKFVLDNNLFKEIKSSLTLEEKNKLIKTAKKELKKHFSTKNDDFVEFSRMIIKTKKFKTFLKNRKNFFSKKKLNIFVACHCFYDAAHVYGKFFYDDFVDWLENLGKISEKTNYQWFLKKHPHSLNQKLTDKLLGNFAKKYPKFQIIPEDIDNRSLKKYIDLVLTVHGSVSYEMAYLNKNVILASRPDHHKAFKFCIYPKNRKEYEKFLLNPKKFKKNKISRKDIFEFYYLTYICLFDFGGFTSAQKILKNNYFTPAIYNYWIKEFNIEKHLFLKNIVKNYVSNKKTLLWDKNKLLN